MSILCFYTMLLWVIGLFMTILNRVGSWMAQDGTIEWFEGLVVGAVWGGR